MPSRILVIEPDPMRQVAIRAALASAGQWSRSIVTAADGAEAVGEGAFDLVLLGPMVDAAAARLALQAGGNTAPVVKLAFLPDCVIGEAAPGGNVPPELPAILEALTRYMRFAPPKQPGEAPEEESLLQDWTEYDRGPQS
ncbi:MAG: hypothetical protein JOZ05_21320 [Acetobacteraceae bacterium]|nr:hypothetical protein [Acetobacteraceae bacterium]